MQFQKAIYEYKKTFLQLTLIHAYKEIFFVRKTIEFDRCLANSVGFQQISVLWFCFKGPVYFWGNDAM